MRPPILNEYRGQLLSLSALQRATGISWQTIASWQRRFGRISEVRIARHKAELAARAERRGAAAHAGVPASTMRMRLARGWDAQRAATEPVQGFRRGTPRRGEKMHKIKNMGAQGDLLVMRVDALPKDVKEEPCGRAVVVAHSETGHHHKLEMRDGFEAKLFRGADPFTCYLQLAGKGDDCADVVHHRAHDTHGTLTLGPGLWMMRNQREYEPEGWRRVAD